MKPNPLCKALCKQLQMESNRRCAPFLNLEDFVLKASTCLGPFQCTVHLEYLFGIVNNYLSFETCGTDRYLGLCIVRTLSIWKNCQHSTESGFSANQINKKLPTPESRLLHIACFVYSWLKLLIAGLNSASYLAPMLSSLLQCCFVNICKKCDWNEMRSHSQPAPIIANV